MPGEDPTDNISVIDQITNMVGRYNELTEEVKRLENMQVQKDEEVKNFKAQIAAELAELRMILDELKRLIDVATKQKMNVGSEFKQIIKADQFNKLSRRVDAQNYEDRISRDELYRKVERLKEE